MTIHVMIDCETLSVRSFPAIMSIGAVRFDPLADNIPEPSMDRSGPVYDAQSFYQLVDVDSCTALGATIDASTLGFWLAPEQAQALKWSWWSQGIHMIGLRPRTLPLVLEMLSTWIQLPHYMEPQAAECVWSHGLLADGHWLANAYEVCKLPLPWHYRAGRDTRTLFELNGDPEPGNWPQAKIKHHPVYDAWAQARAVQLKYKTLGITKLGG